MTKCVCGYEKIGKLIDENGHYVDVDPEKKNFKEIKIVGKEYDEWFHCYAPKEFVLKVCPVCSTIKMEEF